MSRAAEHYHVSDETQNPIWLNHFLSEHEDDPAIKVSLKGFKFNVISFTNSSRTFFLVLETICLDVF